MAIVEAEPNDIAALHSLALCADEEGRFRDAINWYDRGLVLNLGNKELWMGKGVALYRLGRTAEAKRSLERALRFDPEYTSALVWLGKVAIAERRYEEALEQLDRALALDPDDDGALFTKGVTLSLGFGRFDQALECYDRALGSAGKNVDVLTEKGVAHRALGQFAEGAAVFRRVLELAPGDGHARRNLEACEAELRGRGSDTEGEFPGRGLDGDGPIVVVEWDGDEDASPEDDGAVVHPDRKIRCPRCSHINIVAGTPGPHDIRCDSCGAAGTVTF
jgi:tetratricopeptide (TPR) repeat protein